jgi:hypothetical protein
MVVHNHFQELPPDRLFSTVRIGVILVIKLVVKVLPTLPTTTTAGEAVAFRWLPCRARSPFRSILMNSRRL